MQPIARRCSRLASPALALLVLALAASEAAAATETEPERRRAGQEDTGRRPVALTFNPLGLVIQRYGGNVEYSFAPHHVVAGTLYVQSVPVEMVRPFASGVEIRDPSTSPGFGGELGYRLYSGRKGAHGLFVGGSLVAMPVAYPRLGRDFVVELERVYGMGGAIDVGAQGITSFGLTIGGGIGASFLAYDMPDDPRRLPFTIPTVLPRLLLQTGYAF
jgi:hypothetical protein